MDNNKKMNSSTGLQSNLAGALTYVFGFITGIIFILIEKEDQFVRFHAVQSIILSLVLVILSTVLRYIPIINLISALLLGPISFVLWILLIYKAYKNEWFELPVIGQIAKDQVNKTNI